MRSKVVIFLSFSLVLAVLLTSCSIPTENSGGSNSSGQNPVASQSEPSETPITPTDTVRPTRTPNPFPNPTLRVMGEEQVVFDWSADRCAYSSIPDLPSRAIRGADGLVQLFISNTVP